MMRQVRQTPVTMILLLITVLVFLAMQLLFFGQATSVYAVFSSGGLYGNLIKAIPSQSWRLLSPIFVHIGWEHAIINSLLLYFIGQQAERLFGSLRFLVLYVLSGLMGNLFTLFFTPSVVAAGASTSLFGVFGAFAILGYFGKNTYLKQLGRQYQVLIAFNLIFNLFSTEIGMAGHLGGLVGGVLCAIFLSNHFDKTIFASHTRLRALLLYFALALGLFGLAIFI